MGTNTWRYSVSYAESASRTSPIPLQGSMEAALKTAALLGYDAIEFHTREDAILDFSKIQKLLQENNIKICNIVTGRLCTEEKCTLLDDSVYIRERAMSGMKRYIEIAETLEAGVVIGWVKGIIPSGNDRVEYMQRLSDALKELNEYSNARNVKLFIEVINRYETNIFTTAKETCDFLLKNDLDNCYVHLDTFHMGIEETDPYEAIRYCRDKLGYIHVADNSRHYPGSGMFNFEKILEALSDINFEGYINLECLPEPDGETAAKNGINYLKLCAHKL